MKSVILYSVYNSEEKPSSKFSVLLREKLNHSYTYLANFFLKIEASTIEQYLISLIVKRIKEFIILEEHTLLAVALKPYYSSVSHLSNQFKNTSGLTPSYFKALKEKRRITIQIK